MKQTQGRKLISLLKRRAMTSMQLQLTGISTCWWKRVAESLKPDEQLIGLKAKADDPVKKYAIVRRHDFA